MSRAAWNAILALAMGTLVVLAIALYRAGLVPPPAPEAEAPPAPAAPSVPSFATPAEAAAVLGRLRRAGLEKSAADLAYLAECLGDPRQLPVASDFLNPPAAPEVKPDGAAEPKAQQAARPEVRLRTVSAIARKLLILAGLASASPTLARLRAIQTRSVAGQDWTKEDFHVLQAGLSTLGEIQLRNLPEPRPADPPLLLVANTTEEVPDAQAGGAAGVRREYARRPLGRALFTDKRITTAAETPIPGQPAEYEVTPERLGVVLDALEQALRAP